MLIVLLTLLWVRTLSWRQLNLARGSGLFDLSQDIGEQNDLSQAQPQKLAELQRRFAAWRQAMDRAEPRGPFRDF